MRFPLSTGMAKNGNFIPVIERNRALIPGPKGNNGNKGGEYFPHAGPILEVLPQNFYLLYVSPIF